MPDFYSLPANQSAAFTVGDLARRLDLAPSDVLVDLISAGVGKFWHEGRAFNRETLQPYLNLQHFFNPVPELEVELTASQMQWLAAMADADPSIFSSVQSAEERSLPQVDKPRRKFVGSQAELQEASAKQRVGKLG